jgi:autotransporter-associated beta strand protein
VNYVRGDISGNWTAFGGQLNVSNNGSDTDEFRVANANGFPNARLNVGTNILMYSRVAGTIPIGEFTAAAGSTISAGFGSSLGSQSAVTWRVGGLNTDATNAALIQGTTSLTKEGAGAWTLTGANTYSGITTVNGGTLLINGNHSAATGPINVASGGKLGGTGTIGGVTTVNGTLAPGLSIGTLTFNSDLTFGPTGTALMELSRQPFTNDSVQVAGVLTFEGTLQVANTGVELLKSGDNFKLFNAPAYNGSFNNLASSALEEGLAWNTSRLSVDGRLWVVSILPPAITNSSVSGGNLTFSGSGGTPNWDYYVLTSTNLALPMAQWTRIATNQFDSGGAFNYAAALDPNLPRRFYLLESR